MTDTADSVLSDYYTPPELAAQLNRTTRTLDRWRTLAEGPPVTKIGRQVLYRKSSVRAWLEAREQEAA